MRGGGVVSRSTRAAPAPIVAERSISRQTPSSSRRPDMRAFPL